MKRHIAAILAALFITLGVAANLSGCGENVLRVGFDPSFEPMSYQEEDGTCRGYFLDIMEEAAHRMGMEFEAVPIWWSERDWYFMEQKMNCFIDCQNNETLTKEHLWSFPLLEGPNRVLVLANSEYKDVSDFVTGEYNLLLRRSSEEGNMLRFTNLPQSGCLMSFRTLIKALSDLKARKAQGVLVNEYVGKYILNKYPNEYRILPTELDPSTYAVGFHLGNVELQAKVNEVLTKMEADGTLAKISEQWFGRDITKEFT